MTDKKVTRKEFLLSALSFVAVAAASKLPSIVKGSNQKVGIEGAQYGNSAYGGAPKKNA